MAPAGSTGTPSTGTPSLREKHATERRQRIIDAALDLFGHDGFEATTVDAIAARADVSPRTFFRYFPTKEAVLFHDLDDRLAQVRDALLARPPDEPPAAALAETLCQLIEQVDDAPAERRVLLRVLAEQPGLLSYQRTTILETADNLVVTALATRAGRTEPDLALRSVVGAISACFDIALRRWIEIGTTTPFRSVFHETLRACGEAFADLDDTSRL